MWSMNGPSLCLPKQTHRFFCWALFSSFDSVVQNAMLSSRTDDPDGFRARLHARSNFICCLLELKFRVPKWQLNLLFVAWTSRRRFTPVTVATVQMKGNSATRSLDFDNSGEQRGSREISIFIHFLCICFLARSLLCAGSWDH